MEFLLADYIAFSYHMTVWVRAFAHHKTLSIPFVLGPQTGKVRVFDMELLVIDCTMTEFDPDFELVCLCCSETFFRDVVRDGLTVHP